MEYRDFLIIGGGVAGYNAAKRIRRADANASVTMVTADSLAPYHLPPLSKEFLRGQMTTADLAYPPFETIKLAPIEILTSMLVTQLDPINRTASLSDGRQLAFGQALLAPGALLHKLSVPGALLPEVFYLRSAADAGRIASAAAPGRRAVVVGAGFIGLEVAASLRSLGVEVTLVEAASRIWPRFADSTVTELVHSHAEAQGVKIVTGEAVVAIEGTSHVQAVVLAGGRRIACDFVCAGIGIRPDTALAEQAGLEINNGIVVDDMMRTSAANIFAAGDAITYPDPNLKRYTRAEHWGHAEYSGQIAGRNMSGEAIHYDFLAYSWTDIFDLHFECAGHMDGHDQIVIRGDIDEKQFTALYLMNDRLVAYCALNSRPVEFAAYRKLIRSRLALGGKLDGLRDPTIPAQSLVQP